MPYAVYTESLNVGPTLGSEDVLHPAPTRSSNSSRAGKSSGTAKRTRKFRLESTLMEQGTSWGVVWDFTVFVKGRHGIVI